MKKITLTTLLLFAIGFVFAQNANLVVFTEKGERFTLILNGIQYNETPQTNVRVEYLNEAPYKARVIFEDRMLNPLDKTIYTAQNKETTYAIRFMGDSKSGQEVKKFGNSLIKAVGNTDTFKDKEEQYKMKLISQVDIQRSNADNVSSTNSNINNTGSQTTVTSTTTSTNVNSNPNNATISMNVNVNDNMDNENVGMNVNVTDNYSHSETTTVTTTTGNTSTSNNTSVSDHRCDYPMDNSDFIDAKSSIESKTFADSKMTIAKQITKANCPTAEQIRDFTKLFTFESGKVDYAKFAYDYCYDKANYYKVNDAFQFESSIDELNDHIGE